MEEEIDSVIRGMLAIRRDRLRSITREGLADYWHFSPQKNWTPEQAIYEFHLSLKLYERACRDWEEMHNGRCCVVERVRDQYLMPKIREFSDFLRNNASFDAK